MLLTEVILPVLGLVVGYWLRHRGIRLPLPGGPAPAGPPLGVPALDKLPPELQAFLRQLLDLLQKRREADVQQVTEALAERLDPKRK